MIEIIIIDSKNQRQQYLLATTSPSILEAFEDAGYNYPHGCRVGVCGSCLSEVIAGEENLSPPTQTEHTRIEEFNTHEQQQGNPGLDKTKIRFICRTTAHGNVTLRPLAGSIRKQ